MRSRQPPGQVRHYRHQVNSGALTAFAVTVKETDLQVHAQRDLSALTRAIVLRQRGYLERYLAQNPEFYHSLKPLAVSGPAPEIVRAMAAAGAKAGVGPMAAVAGAMAAEVGSELMAHPQGSDQVVVENGGDIFAKTDFPLTVGIYAGKSPLSLKVGLRLVPAVPMGICTSSGTLGHSLSLGKADAVCIVSVFCALADAAATAVGNRVKDKADIQAAIAFAREIEGVSGVVIIAGDAMGAWGELEIVSLPGKKG